MSVRPVTAVAVLKFARTVASAQHFRRDVTAYCEAEVARGPCSPADNPDVHAALNDALLEIGELKEQVATMIADHAALAEPNVDPPGGTVGADSPPA